MALNQDPSRDASFKIEHSSFVKTPRPTGNLNSIEKKQDLFLLDNPFRGRGAKKANLLLEIASNPIAMVPQKAPGVSACRIPHYGVALGFSPIALNTSPARTRS